MSRYQSCFISYATPDEKFARRINDFLKQNGVSTWAWFEQGKLGEWRPQIQSALDEKECIILIISAAAIKRSGVQDENRLALADDLRPYSRRLLPILLEKLPRIQEAASTPEERELLNFIKRVTWIDLTTGKKPWLAKTAQSKLLFLLQRPVVKVMVMGSVSQEDEAENNLKRPFIQSLARCIGRQLALDYAKPICMATRGGGIDPFVCEGVQNSLSKHDLKGRLWVYPEVREVVAYKGDGRDVQINLPILAPNTTGRILTEMTRVKLVISKMAVEADSIIALRGGRGVEHAAIMALAQRKRIVIAPGLGGAGEELYRHYRGMPEVIAPEGCQAAPSSWDPESEEVDKFAKLLVDAALRDVESNRKMMA
jgi:hypothetical protein